MDVTEDPMIRLEGVGKTYADGTVAVQELDLDVRRGEMVCLVGPSGCGKSTTLKMVNRLIEPSRGRIFIDGEDVTGEDPVKLRRGIGYVIQQVGLFPHQKIVTNVMTVPLLYGESRAKARERAHELLHLVGLDPDHVRQPLPPPALRRPAAAGRRGPGARRGPAGAADGRAVRRRRPGGPRPAAGRVPAAPARARARPSLFVTHDIDEAVKMGDRVAVFAEGGRLAQYDIPAAILGRPADDFVSSFVGASRGLRRLAVTPIDRAHLEPMDGVTAGELGGAIDADASLEDALALLMREDKPMIGVKQGATFLGVLTPNGVHRALRASVSSQE